MSDTQWDAQFEDIVRRLVPFLPEGQALDADADLQDHGLDSFGIIDLLVSIESAYGVQFRDDAMNRETFATPSTLWTAISDLRSQSV